MDLMGTSGLGWPLTLPEVLVFSEQAFDENELSDGPTDRFDCHFWCVAGIVGQGDVGGEGRFDPAAETCLDEGIAERFSEVP